MWSGNDGDTLPIMALGGYGVVSVLSHLVGVQIKEMIDSFVGGANVEAAKIHGRLLPLVNSMFVVSNPIPLKYAMRMIGFDVGGDEAASDRPDEATGAKIMAEVGKHTMDLPIPAKV